MAIVATRFPTALDEAYRLDPRIDVDLEGIGPVVIDAGTAGQIRLGDGVGLRNETDPDDPFYAAITAGLLRFQRQGRMLDLTSNSLEFTGSGGFDTSAGDYTVGLDKETGGGGGGDESGGPAIVTQADAPVIVSDVDGTGSYDVILINFTAPGPTAARITFYVPAGTPSAMLAAAMGQDPSAIAFCSGEAEFTSSPGPVLVAQGAGSSYVYDDAPLLGSTVGTIEVVHSAVSPPAIFWTGSAYAVSYSPLVLDGVDYDSVASESGVTADAFLFLGVGGSEPIADYDLGYYIRRGRASDRGQDQYGLIGLGMDLDRDTAIGIVRAPRVILGDDLSSDPRWPSVQITRAANFSSDPNDMLMRLGADGDVDGSSVLRPGYRFAVASDSLDPSENSGQVFYAERPVAGQAPSFAPPYGDVEDDVEVWTLGWQSREAPKVLVLGDVNHFRSGSDGESDRPFGGIIMMKDAFTNGIVADPLKAVGETVHIWSPSIYNPGDPPSTISPFTMIMGDPFGSQAAFVLTNSCGGELAGAGSHDDPWLGFSKRGRRVQAYMTAGLDLTDTLFPPGGPPEIRNAALLVSASETEFLGDVTFASGMSGVRDLGATPPTGHYDPHPSRQSDNPDIRPNMYAAYVLDIGAGQYYYQRTDGASPEPGQRTYIHLHRQEDYPFAFDAANGGGSAGARMPYIVLESQNGTPYYVWVTDAGQFRVSAAEPDDDADAFVTTTA